MGVGNTEAQVKLKVGPDVTFGNGDEVVVDNPGNLGVKTTNPQASLDVANGGI